MFALSRLLKSFDGKLRKASIQNSISEWQSCLGNQAQRIKDAA